MRRICESLGLTCAVVFVVVTVSGCATAPTRENVSASRQASAKAIEETASVPTQELRREDAAPTEGGQTPAAKEGDPATVGVDTEPAAKEEAYATYRIGPGDVLGFRSFDDETLNSQIVVRYDGYVSLPLVPDLKVQDKTRDEALAMVRDAYSMFYQEPQVSLVIVEPKSKKFAVMGDVERPAEYPYTQPITLLDGLNAAGGLRINTRGGDSFIGAQGQLVKALIIRHAEDKRDVLEFDLRGIRKSGPHPSDTPVMPGDIIYVPEGLNLVYLLGQVRTPGVFALSEGMTMLQLLAQAGSFDPATARLRQVVLMREQDETVTKIMLVNVRHMLKTAEDLPLQAGDIIYVPQKPLVNISQFVARFTSSISPILSLYRQAFDTYYTQKFYDQMFKNPSTSAFDFTTLQRTLGSIGSLITTGHAKLAPLAVAK